MRTPRTSFSVVLLKWLQNGMRSRSHSPERLNDCGTWVPLESGEALGAQLLLPQSGVCSLRQQVSEKWTNWQEPCDISAKRSPSNPDDV